MSNPWLYYAGCMFSGIAKGFRKICKNGRFVIVFSGHYLSYFCDFFVFFCIHAKKAQALYAHKSAQGFNFAPQLALGVQPCGSLGVDWLKQKHSRKDFWFDATDLMVLGWGNSFLSEFIIY